MVRKISLWLLLLLVITISANALLASIDKPKMVLYKNVTPEKPLVFNESVIVNNKNEYEVKIEIEQTGDLKNITNIEEKEFVLNSKQRKEVFYEITITKPGTYRGDIIVKFSETTNKNVGAALAQTLVILVNGIGNFEEEQEQALLKSEEEQKETEEKSEEIKSTNTESTTGALITDTKEKKPSILIGILIIIVFVVLGFLIYLLIFLRGKKK